MKIKQFKIRASASGKIMAARGLGKTGETYLQEWLKEQIFGVRKQIKSKYIDKGNLCEDDSIDFIANRL